MAEQHHKPRFGKVQLEKILQQQLGKDLVVERFTSIPNTKAGDNYGSVMLALEVTLRRTKDLSPETQHVVAKLAPPTEFLQTVFDFKVTFCKEMNIYKLVVPEFQKLQRQNRIPEQDIWNNIADYYGAQTSLGGYDDDVADTNAALLMENLKIRGYKLVDKFAGLDLNHCEMVLRTLAHFHALAIALRKKKPLVYENTVLKATVPFNQGGGLEDTEKEVDKLLTAIKQNIPESHPYLERMRKQCIENRNHGNESLKKEPFATIVHNDLWTNNLMFTYDENSSPTDVKFVDFQTTLLCSPVKDLIFFLFVSPSDEVFKKHFDHLVKHYHTNLIDLLKKVRCDTSAFSFEKFEEEISEFAPTQFQHVLFMLSILFTEKTDLIDLSKHDGNHEIKLATGNTCKRKMLTLIQEFDKRGWLEKIE